jgi:hypothetical protein
MLKSTTTSFILSLILLLAASQTFAGIVVLERLKTESIIFKATGERLNWGEDFYDTI